MMDANDVLFVGDGQRILDAYQALNTPIVASAERGCAPSGSGLELGLLCSVAGRSRLQLYPMHPDDADHHVRLKYVGRMQSSSGSSVYTGISLREFWDVYG